MERVGFEPSNARARWHLRSDQDRWIARAAREPALPSLVAKRPYVVPARIAERRNEQIRAHFSCRRSRPGAYQNRSASACPAASQTAPLPAPPPQAPADRLHRPLNRAQADDVASAPHLTLDILSALGADGAVAHAATKIRLRNEVAQTALSVPASASHFDGVSPFHLPTLGLPRPRPTIGPPPSIMPGLRPRAALRR